MMQWIQRAIAAGVFAALLSSVVPTPPARADEPVVRIGAGETQARRLSMTKGKSVVIELPRDAKDVLVANPDVANAVVRSARRAFLIGTGFGQTNVVFFDADGRQIATFEIEVSRDIAGLRATLRRLLPNADIHVEQVGNSVVLSGTVADANVSAQATEIAEKLMADTTGSTSGPTGSAPTTANAPSATNNLSRVVNALTIKTKDQVMIKVVVAEVQRDVLKQFGVDLYSAAVNAGTSFAIGNLTNIFSTNGQAIAPGGFPAYGSGSGAAATFKNSRGSVTAVVQAMEQAGVMRLLAEPTLTAISGEQAKFLAGGEFPVTVGRTCDNTGVCTVDIKWKPFGVGLEFTPVVLSEGRISLRVGTEVSELTSEGAVQISGLTIKALRVRRASSTVEMSSGGSIVMAGLIKEETKQTVNGTPGLMNIPVLGTLFRSRDYQAGQTELMVIVTPYVVNQVARSRLQTPDEGFAAASDPSTIFLGRLNRVYGVAGRVDPRRPYHGSYGFIID